MKTIQKGRIGFVLWLLTCTLGSFIVVSIERYHWNKTEGHFMSIPDLILLSGIVTAFLVCTYLSKSIFDAIQILGPYFLLALISKYFFLKIERTATSIK